MTVKAAVFVAAFAVFCARSHASSRRMLIEGGTWVTENGETFYKNPPQSADTCTDVAPDQRFTCDQQKNFGACDQSFMKDNNYCLYTCGRCPSSPAPPSSPSQGGGSPAPPSSPPSSGGFAKPGDPNVCDDIAPNGEYTCAEQRDFGKCSEWYIVENHFCARTCGLPPCPPVANLPRRNGTSTSRRPARSNATVISSTVTEAGPQPILTATPITTPPIGAAVENTTVEATNTTLATPAAEAANVTAPVVPPTTALPAVTPPTEVPPAPVTPPVVVLPAPIPTGPTTITTAPAVQPTTPPAEPVAAPVAAPVPPVVTPPAASPLLAEPTAETIPAAEPPTAEPGLTGGLPGATTP